MPRAVGGCWDVYGLSATGQGAGGVLGVGAVPPSPDLGLDLGLHDFGLDFGPAAQRGARTGPVTPLAPQGVEASVDQSTGPGQCPGHGRSWRGASSSTHPSPGWASRGSDQAWLAAGTASLSLPVQPPKPPGPGSIAHQEPAQLTGGLRPRQHKEWL